MATLADKIKDVELPEFPVTIENKSLVNIALIVIVIAFLIIVFNKWVKTI